MARVTPYQFSKIHAELKLRPQAVYQFCLKQAAPHKREKDGRIVINDGEFLAWLKKRQLTRAAKVALKQAKLTPV